MRHRREVHDCDGTRRRVFAVVMVIVSLRLFPLRVCSLEAGIRKGRIAAGPRAVRGLDRTSGVWWGGSLKARTLSPSRDPAESSVWRVRDRQGSDRGIKHRSGLRRPGVGVRDRLAKMRLIARASVGARAGAVVGVFYVLMLLLGEAIGGFGTVQATLRIPLIEAAVGQFLMIVTAAAAITSLAPRARNADQGMAIAFAVCVVVFGLYVVALYPPGAWPLGAIGVVAMAGAVSWGVRAIWTRGGDGDSVSIRPRR